MSKDIQEWFELVKTKGTKDEVQSKVDTFIESHQDWDINTVNERGGSLLTTAIVEKNYQLVSVLLEKGIAITDWDTKISSYSFPYNAFISELVGTKMSNLVGESREVLEWINQQFNKEWNRLIDGGNGRYKEVRNFLELQDGWDINTEVFAKGNIVFGSGKKNPLVSAAEAQNTKLAGVLLQHGAVITQDIANNQWDNLNEVIQQLPPSSVVLVENAAVAENVLEVNPELRPVVFDKEKYENYMKFANNRARIKLTAKETEYSTFTNSWVRSLYNDQNMHVSDEITQYLYSFLGTQELTPKEMKAIEEYMGSKDTHKNPMELYIHVTEKTSFRSQQQERENQKGGGKGGIPSPDM